VAANAMHRATEMHRDVVPIGKLLRDTAIARRIVFLEIVERRIGEHHTETEGVIGAVAFIDRNLGLGPLLFQQDRGVKAGRSATDDRELHERLRKGNLEDILNLKYLLTSPGPAGFA